MNLKRLSVLFRAIEPLPLERLLAPNSYRLLSWCASMVDHFVLRPGFDAQSGNAREFPNIVGNESEATCQGLGGDQ